jgi:hypothetical protein
VTRERGAGMFLVCLEYFKSKQRRKPLFSRCHKRRSRARACVLLTTVTRVGCQSKRK